MDMYPSFQLELARQRQRELPAAEQPRGELLYLRQLGAGDREALSRAFSRLSPLSRYWRYSSAKADLAHADLDRLTDLDPPRSDALGAFRTSDDELVGVVEYAAREATAAPELAVVVVDDWQRRGVGTVLANLIIERARTARHSLLHAHVLANNYTGLRLAQRLGFTAAAHDDLFIHYQLPL